MDAFFFFFVACFVYFPSIALNIWRACERIKLFHRHRCQPARMPEQTPDFVSQRSHQLVRGTVFFLLLPCAQFEHTKLPFKWNVCDCQNFTIVACLHDKAPFKKRSGFFVKFFSLTRISKTLFAALSYTSTRVGTLIENDIVMQLCPRLFHQLTMDMK